MEYAHPESKKTSVHQLADFQVGLDVAAAHADDLYDVALENDQSIYRKNFRKELPRAFKAIGAIWAHNPQSSAGELYKMLQKLAETNDKMAFSSLVDEHKSVRRFENQMRADLEVKLALDHRVSEIEKSLKRHKPGTRANSVMLLTKEKQHLLRLRSMLMSSALDDEEYEPEIRRKRKNSSDESENDRACSPVSS